VLDNCDLAESRAECDQGIALRNFARDAVRPRLCAAIVINGEIEMHVAARGIRGVDGKPDPLDQRPMPAAWFPLSSQKPRDPN
jgi:hypothetical protein